jgi:hypothetical protein
MNGRCIDIEVPDPEMVQLLRGKSSAERLAIANRMWTSARDAIQQMLKAEHPDWNQAQLQAEVARRLLHESL